MVPSQSLLQVSDTESTASDGVRWQNVKLRGSVPVRKRALEFEPGDDGHVVPSRGRCRQWSAWLMGGWWWGWESRAGKNRGLRQWCLLHNKVLCWSWSSWRRKMGLLWDLWARKVVTCRLWGSERWRTGMSERRVQDTCSPRCCLLLRPLSCSLTLLTHQVNPFQDSFMSVCS